MTQPGPVGIVLIVLATIVVTALAVLALMAIFFNRRRGGRRERPEFLEDGRIAVLESRDIDERRRLVLVRCDDVEHLIVIGGPADLVIDNDVSKMRPQTMPQKAAAAAPQTAPAAVVPKPAAAPRQEAPQPAASAVRVPPATGESLDAAIAAAVPKSSETPRPSARPAPEPRPPLQRPGLAAVPSRTTARNGEASLAASPARSKETPRVIPQRSAATELTRRDAPAPVRATPKAPLPAPSSAPASAALPSPAPRPQAERPVRAGRANARNGEAPRGLPAAKVPWAVPETLEDEIVKALRFDTPQPAETPAPRNAAAAVPAAPQPSAEAAPSTRTPETPAPRAAEAPSSRREPSVGGKAQIESSATLGDLADRLEEALAREIQSTGPTPRPAKRTEPQKADAAQSQKKSADAEGQAAAPKSERTEKQPEPAQKQSASVAPGPEKREAPASQPERREETSVISLNARRREASDPLEDEMARLLGELTGDTKGL